MFFVCGFCMSFAIIDRKCHQSLEWHLGEYKHQWTFNSGRTIPLLWNIEDSKGSPLYKLFFTDYLPYGEIYLQIDSIIAFHLACQVIVNSLIASCFHVETPDKTRDNKFFILSIGNLDFFSFIGDLSRSLSVATALTANTHHLTPHDCLLFYGEIQSKHAAGKAVGVLVITVNTAHLQPKRLYY